MVEAIYQLIKQIWEEGKMPEEWSIAVLCPIQKRVTNWIVRSTKE
jgi:hypothetical protein